MEEMYFNIGARIRFRDGDGGTLHKVVIDPHTRQVTDLVIVKGFPQRHDYVIPVSAVEQASEDEIQVALFLQELASYPEYREVEFEEWLDDWEHEILYPREHTLVWNPMVGFYEAQRTIIPLSRYRIPKGIPFGEEVIGRSSVVCNAEGVVGKIDHLWLDRESWEITHLVVRRGIIPHYVVIPFAWISSITPAEIFMRGVDSQLKEVPMTLLQLGLTLAAGGEIGSEAKPLDENLTIAEEVDAALSEDPRTAPAVIEVVYERGVITLTGEVENESAHVAAGEIAHRHESVVSLVNALEVRPKPDAGGSVARLFGHLVEHGYGATTAVNLMPTIC
jgi:sporulation protein YlmC with PRC-barrel domain